jgi:hypothetical protein
MPMEEGNYSISMARYPLLKEWIDADRDVVVNGTFEYALAGKKLQSQFQATLFFSRSQSPSSPVPAIWRKLQSRFQSPLWYGRNQFVDVPVPMLWKNMSAT